MRSRILRTEAPVCQLCSFISTRSSIRTQSLRVQSSLQKHRSLSNGQKRSANTPQQSQNSSPTTRPTSSRSTVTVKYDGGKNSGSVTADSIVKDLDKATSIRDKLITTDGVPPDTDVENALVAYQEMAINVMNFQYSTPTVPQKDASAISAASALLSMTRSAAKPGRLAHLKSSALDGASKQLSDLALSILEHPPVFITPGILKHYVKLQSILKLPKPLPSVFHLYATKPIPVEGSSPVKYKEANPNKSANAIETAVADLALQTAIESKDLLTAMDIVDTTYSTTAFRRAKFIRKALFPVTGLSLAPVAAYAIAGQLSLYQTTMDPTVATNIAFVGILGYIGFTTTVGIVAVTTANDQIDRKSVV